MGLFYNIKSKIISFFADIRVYKGGFIIFGDSHYELKGQHMRQIIDVLKPGDVLLRRYSHYLGSILIPGYFSHAALYVGDNSVVHMLGEGITKEDILVFMRCDDIAVLRCQDQNDADNAVAKANQLYLSGVEYDFDFDTDSPKRFYCTEFVDNCFGYPIKKFKGGKKIMPDDFINAGLFKKEWIKK